MSRARVPLLINFGDPSIQNRMLLFGNGEPVVKLGQKPKNLVPSQQSAD
jgi:hypothetical protein